MKKTVLNTLALATLFFASAANAQVGVGVPAENIHPTAELEVKSTTKGFLPPRMTNVERNAIISPATGLLIYQTDAVANNPAGLYYFDGLLWKNGIGAQGEVGPKGDKGDKGETGAAGSMPSGTTLGEMIYWNGTKWASLVTNTNGQILTNCDGLPTWTTGGICPGKIASLNCDGVSVNGALTHGVAVSNVSCVYSYLGGNGRDYSTQNIKSSGVTGLTATLSSGKFTNGNGTVTYIIEGIPSASGTASFEVNVGGKTCTLTLTVNSFEPTVLDIDGNVYKTLIIGNQVWMAENLKVSQYNDRTPITDGNSSTVWKNNTTGAWAYYNRDASNNTKYGKLYNWYAVSPTTNGNKNVCPTGWHVPTDAEWTGLIDYLGGATVAGAKLKEVAPSSWVDAYLCGCQYVSNTNTSLFTALPGGTINTLGDSYFIRYTGIWWSSSAFGANGAWIRNLEYQAGTANRYAEPSRSGNSIRCLRD